MKPLYAVRHSTSLPRYEVYRTDSGTLVYPFNYLSESERAGAMGSANAMRNDMNAAALAAQES